MSIHTEHSAPSQNPANEPNQTGAAEALAPQLDEVHKSLWQRTVGNLLHSRVLDTPLKKGIAAGAAVALIGTGAYEAGSSGNSAPAPRAAASNSAPSHPTKPAPKTSAASTSAAPTNTPSSIPTSAAPSTPEAPAPGTEFGSNTPVGIPYVEGQPATYQDVQLLMHNIDLAITDLNPEDFWYSGINPDTEFAQNVTQNQLNYFQQQKQSNQYVKFYQHNFSEKDVQFDSANPNVVHILCAEGTNDDFIHGGPGVVKYEEYTLTLGPSQVTFPGGSTAELLGIQNVDVQSSTNDAWYNGWPTN